MERGGGGGDSGWREVEREYCEEGIVGGYTVSKTLTPRILLQMIHLAAISEGGKLHLFSSPFESEGKKPVNALCTVQFVSSASEVSGPPLLNSNN